jgi:glutamate synthase (ferredoxin)
MTLLYSPDHERDSCGVGFVADVHGTRQHRILTMAIDAVHNLTHRGAVSADGKTGDGAGILTQIPHRFFRKILARWDVTLANDTDLGVGMLFFPRRADTTRRLCQKIVEGTLTHYGIQIYGWREVPIDPRALGERALRTLPDIQQILLGRPPGLDDNAFERLLYLVRKEIEAQVRGERIRDFYIPSFSHRTLVYKGMFVAPQLPHFYLDLQDTGFETALAVLHQRYSTNTFPNWFLAQPFRMLGHNGEINTLQANRNWMYAREGELSSHIWHSEVENLQPLMQPGASDSMSLDNVLEALVLSGRDIRHAFMMLIPEAWEQMPGMDPALRAFYEYHACLTEPWDGPAAVAFSDGTTVGAVLDRNGFRPARYCMTDDGLVIMASEAGILEIDQAHVVHKGRLGPGQMIAVDTCSGQFYDNDAIKRTFAQRRDYVEWLQRYLLRFRAQPAGAVTSGNGHAASYAPETLLPLQIACGYTEEEVKYVLKPMYTEKKEPTWSMGDDAPLAVLANRPRLLYGYFKQKFAQVTNPPLDPLREKLVMSLYTYLGPRQSFLEESPAHARLVRLSSPVLFDHELAALRQLEHFPALTLSTLMPVADGEQGLEQALERLCVEASDAVDKEYALLVLSDRGLDRDHAAVPMLMAVGAVHHHLIRQRKRMRISLVVETAEAWEVHQLACLIGYGASAVNPYLALATISALGQAEADDAGSPRQAIENYKTSLDYGLRKIMSKMGISTISSYHGAQIFEAIGLSKAIMERCFAGTASRLGGIGLAEVATDVLARHQVAFGSESHTHKMPDNGFYRFRKGGEAHAFNPNVVKALHKATRSGRYEDYKAYANLINSREPISIRDLLRFQSDRSPLPIEEVEPVETIVQRFTTQAMSIGALSPETHSTLARAMNRLNAKSNTGEGGEDPDWWQPLPNGDSAASKIKQVASGRFGVTPEYLARAEQLEIKMAQGSKPGEGGQLPGHKVAAHIARIRRAVEGIPLISPAPHHDIYSIEDLAQLIYDLKMVNPRAKVCVKLVAEEGVGTIAAGVAKGYADVILISGYDGGTGASPISSIKNAGAPWELGLSETQQVLVLNDLRKRVRLRVDGGLKTGRDVVVGACLGAEEYGFGTASVVSVGCVMARQCHLNTCPVGVATQRPELRKRFKGTPDMAVHFFMHLAQEVREILAELGYRSLEEIIGRSDLLTAAPPTTHSKAWKLDLRPILAQADLTDSLPHRSLQDRNDRPDTPLDLQLLADAAEALDHQKPVRLFYPIRNIHRTVGARLSGEIARRYGDLGLPDGTIDIRFEGSAGQSFGAFTTAGVRLVLNGEGNDYVGKGMGGGEIIIKPHPTARFASSQNAIIGNTVLYGATGGTLFTAGRAGERFAVRNSGATAVVEGVGDHGCEYMTAGYVVVLGKTGRNFGAGMTNGQAYVLDEGDAFPKCINPEMIRLARLEDAQDIETLRAMIERHYQATESQHARAILDRWPEMLPLFWKVIPLPAEAIAKDVEVAKKDKDDEEVAATASR